MPPHPPGPLSAASASPPPTAKPHWKTHSFQWYAVGPVSYTHLDHLLNEDEFKQYQRIYTEKCEAIAAAISKRQEELDAIVRAGSPQGEWIAHFKSFRHVDVMERKILVKIIDSIYVYEGNRIEIIFKYQNEYRAAAAYIEQYIERQACLLYTSRCV